MLDGLDGNFRAGRVHGDAAAIGMGASDHIIDAGGATLTPLLLPFPRITASRAEREDEDRGNDGRGGKEEYAFEKRICFVVQISHDIRSYKAPQISDGIDQTDAGSRGGSGEKTRRQRPEAREITVHSRGGKAEQGNLEYDASAQHCA